MPPITPMVQNIIIACGIIWLLQVSEAFDYTAFMVSRPQFAIWQPFTYMWLHDHESIFHVLMNMFALYLFGTQLESVWGSKRFLRFYLICGIFAGFLIFGWDVVRGNMAPTLGASGAVYGVLTAYSLTWPNRTIMLLFPPIPIRAIYLIPLLFLMQLSMATNVSHIGHLGGVIAALLMMRGELPQLLSLQGMRYRWHRYRMRGRLRAVRREEWQRRSGSDRDGPTLH